ncbi:MAG: porphobilinogen deaminase, partial [Halobacteriaceae archaeon]
MANLSTITLATRTSDLAQRQAEIVKNELERRRYTVSLEGVSTTGDEIKDSLIHELGSKGAFVRDLDHQVLSGEADCAIHSLKDVPTEQPDDLTIAAVLERGPPEDVLITPNGKSLEEMPA